MVHHKKQDMFMSSIFVKNDDDCCICKKKMESNKSYLCGWTCGHWQCVECWNTYKMTCLIQNKKRTCPMCRHEFSKEPYYLVFKYIKS